MPRQFGEDVSSGWGVAPRSVMGDSSLRSGCLLVAQRAPCCKMGHSSLRNGALLPYASASLPPRAEG
eukprot:9789778-Alexandrium_andersonii.AAC.1